MRTAGHPETPGDDAIYRYHVERERRLRRQKERTRRQWYDQVRDAVRRLAPAHPAVKRVYVFGSLVRPGHFHRASDVDLAVDCEDLEAESRFWRALERDLRRDVDLRPRRGPVADAVESYGKLLYEREVPRP